MPTRGPGITGWHKAHLMAAPSSSGLGQHSSGSVRVARLFVLLLCIFAFQQRPSRWRSRVSAAKTELFRCCFQRATTALCLYRWGREERKEPLGI